MPKKARKISLNKINIYIYIYKGYPEDKHDTSRRQKKKALGLSKVQLYLIKYIIN